jgi:hypothetical protein
MAGSNKNTSYSCQIMIKVTDGFGNFTSLSSSFVANYIENPKLSGSLVIKHGYDTNSYNNLIEVTSSNKNTYLFNSGEKIVFSFPKATDKNNDIVKY